MQISVEEVRIQMKIYKTYHSHSDFIQDIAKLLRYDSALYCSIDPKWPIRLEVAKINSQFFHQILH